VLDNAKKYNPAGSLFYKAASRIYPTAVDILEGLEREVSSPLVDADAQSSIGDLEPDMEVIDLLTANQLDDATKEELEFVLEADPLPSLLNYEFSKPKPPPPPPPPKPKKPKVTRRPPGRQTKDAGAVQQLDRAAGFRARRTRASGLAGSEIQTGESAAGEDVEVAPAPSTRGPPMVEELNQHGMFANFHQGWIFPESTRRVRVASSAAQTPATSTKKRGRKSFSAATYNVR
jgi:hypothetical protein